MHRKYPSVPRYRPLSHIQAKLESLEPRPQVATDDELSTPAVQVSESAEATLRTSKRSIVRNELLSIWHAMSRRMYQATTRAECSHGSKRAATRMPVHWAQLLSNVPYESRGLRTAMDTEAPKSAVQSLMTYICSFRARSSSQSTTTDETVVITPHVTDSANSNAVSTQSSLREPEIVQFPRRKKTSSEIVRIKRRSRRANCINQVYDDTPLRIRLLKCQLARERQAAMRVQKPRSLQSRFLMQMSNVFRSANPNDDEYDEDYDDAISEYDEYAD
ncbi:hypothetical protein V1512DRAFT_259621 [Lipomyces arxii]|uniref:uncharacterized protein n=1 Tax=Lipomyces arxii TaxID=56418 RepID=UPI0034CF4289